MTAERLQQIKARADAATKGPWEYGIRRDRSMWMSMGDPVAGPHIQADWDFAEANAAFCTNARTDVPDLVAALEAAQKRIAGLEVANANLNGHLTHEARLADSNLEAYKEVRGLHEAMRSRADGLEIECERLKQTLRSIVVTCGGIAQPGVSTDFLVSTAEEVRLMKEELLQKVQRLEMALSEAKASAAIDDARSRV